ncbi:MAG TPA: aldo/keto reductase [Polyangiales bacterium]
MTRVDVAHVGSFSRLVFGCASVGGRVSVRTSLRAMAMAFERGVTSFDVARSYGYGEAESVLGRFLLGRREAAQIVTKAGILAPKPSRLLSAAKSVARKAFAMFPRARVMVRPALGRQHQSGHFAPGELEASLAASLRALRTDHVDVLLLHGCDPATLAREDVRNTLQGFVRRGMARRIGVAAGAREAELWVVQGDDPTAALPARELAGFPQRDQSGLWLVNQPFGGGEALARLQQVCTRQNLPPTSALEFLLRRPFAQGATAVVLSMLSAGHVESALRAFSAGAPQADVTATLERMLMEDE